MGSPITGKFDIFKQVKDNEEAVTARVQGTQGLKGMEKSLCAFLAVSFDRLTMLSGVETFASSR
jgi:hypothetical protein